MGREVVHTDKAPAAVGPYSQAIKSDGFLFSAGQVAIDPAVGKLIEADVAGQAEQVMRNLEAVLTEAGLGFGDVVKTTIYLTTMDHFSAVNEVYGARFPADPPARSTVAVAGLPLGALVEIDVVARLG